MYYINANKCVVYLVMIATNCYIYLNIRFALLNSIAATENTTIAHSKLKSLIELITI